MPGGGTARSGRAVLPQAPSAAPAEPHALRAPGPRPSPGAPHTAGGTSETPALREQQGARRALRARSTPGPVLTWRGAERGALPPSPAKMAFGSAPAASSLLLL